MTAFATVLSRSGSGEPSCGDQIWLPGKRFATMRENLAINRVEWVEWPEREAGDVPGA